jgi:hypothetical protein
VTIHPTIKITIPPSAKMKDTLPSSSKDHDNDELMDNTPAFKWSNSDIPGTCVVFDCSQAVPYNIPQLLVDLLHMHSKMLYKSPGILHSVDLIETNISLEIGICQHENCTIRMQCLMDPQKTILKSFQITYLP